MGQKKESNLKKRIALILKQEKYIEDFFFIADENNKETIRIFLKYDYQGNPAIDKLKRVSRPGLRVYTGSSSIPRVLDGLGISILSTSKGVISNKTAKKIVLKFVKNSCGMTHKNEWVISLNFGFEVINRDSSNQF